MRLPRVSTSGITNGMAPLGFWSAARSPSHLVKKPATSMLNAAVGAKTWASPVQPMRSSRCGQSVGTSRKLPFCPHTMLCCSWLIAVFDVSKLPVGVMSEWITMPVRLSVVGAPGKPSTAT